MSTLIEFLAVAGAVINGFSLLAFYAGTRAGHSTAEASIDWLRAELRQANDRLYAVSREPGAIVPARDPDPLPAIELPAELERLVGDWDSPDVQATLRAQFIKQLGEGLSVSEVQRRHLEA